MAPAREQQMHCFIGVGILAHCCKQRVVGHHPGGKRRGKKRARFLVDLRQYHNLGVSPERGTGRRKAESRSRLNRYRQAALAVAANRLILSIALTIDESGLAHSFLLVNLAVATSHTQPAADVSVAEHRMLPVFSQRIPTPRKRCCEAVRRS